MSRSLKNSFVLGAVAAAALVAMPAQALVVIGFGNVNTDENVLFSNSTSVATPTLVGTTNQSKVDVTFANALGLLANASGQSSTTNDSTPLYDTDALFGTTRVTIASPFTFRAAQFNIDGVPGNPPPPEASSVFVEALGLAGAVIGSNTLTIDGNGENRIGISGNAGEMFTGFRFTLLPGVTTANPLGSGVSSLSQVRLGGVASPSAPVPEPAAWMLMIVGFAGVGFAMRKKNHTQTARVRFV